LVAAVEAAELVPKILDIKVLNSFISN